jgi:hypothetical protein
MGELRIFIPDNLHADILDLAKKDELRLPEEVVSLLAAAVGARKRPPLVIRDLAYLPSGLVSQEDR